ncbi:MAG: hypothetical protein RBU37_28125, partial [Myxococcota bacterium]|nr:hypothetical protein [Myxococcota bacterium]
TCGNSVCDAGETGTYCPADCGEEAACGDAVCVGDEDAANCPADCAIETCGNSVCDEGETSSNCPADCGEEAICGDSLCEGDEDVDNCPADCAEGEGEQRCEDQVDNDGDGYVDCDDYDCRWSQVELCGAEATDELCNDGVDNDGDGYNDCQDHDCSRNPNVTVCHGGTSSEENTNEACSDHIDNDMDGHYDCDDHDCSQNSSVTVCSSTQANERVTKYHAADIDYGFQEMVVSGVYDSIVDTVPWGCVAQEPGNDSLIWRIKNGEENAIVFTFSLPDAPLLEPALYFYEASFCENCDDFLPTYSYMSFKLNGVDFYSEMLWECPGETNFGAELNDFLHPGLNTIEVFSNPDTELLHGLQGVHLEYEYCTNGSGC